MYRRIVTLPIWTHPKYGTAARIAVAVVALEIARACGDVYNGETIGASLVSDVFTSFLPMAWLPSGIGLGILAKRITQSRVVGFTVAALAAAALLWGALELEEWLGPHAWL